MAKMMGASLDQEGFRIFQDGVETVVYLGREARVLGAVSLGDKLRETSSRALAALRASGVRTIAMMTGDRRAVALRIGIGAMVAERRRAVDPHPEAHRLPIGRGP